MIRVSHILAAFLGATWVLWLQWSDGVEHPRSGVLLWAILFGLLWECMLRLSVLFKGLFSAESADKWRSYYRL